MDKTVVGQKSTLAGTVIHRLMAGPGPTLTIRPGLQLHPSVLTLSVRGVTSTVTWEWIQRDTSETVLSGSGRLATKPTMMCTAV